MKTSFVFLAVYLLGSLQLLTLASPLAAPEPLIVPTPSGSSKPKSTVWVNPYLSKRATYSYQPQQVWFEHNRAWCFPIDDNKRVTWRSNPKGDGSGDSEVLINPVLVPVYQNGTSAGYPVFQLIPTDDYYSGVVSFIKIVVPNTYKKDQIPKYNKLSQTGFPMYPSGYFYMPIVPKRATFMDASSPVAKQLKNVKVKPAWYMGRPVYYIQFGMIPVDPAVGAIPTAEYYRIINGSSFPVISDVPNWRGEYTGFFTVFNYTSDQPDNFYRSVTQLKNKPDLVRTNTILACPVVFYEEESFQGIPPGPAPTPAFTSLIPAQGNSWVGGVNIFTAGGGEKNISVRKVFADKTEYACWDFGTSSFPGLDAKGKIVVDQEAVHVNTVLQPIYSTKNQDGSPKLAGELVFQSIPTLDMYSDAVEVRFVTVADGSDFNLYKDYETLAKLGLGGSDGIFNLPIVPYGSTIKLPAAAVNWTITFEVPQKEKGWYNGQEIEYFNIAEIIDNMISGNNAVLTGAGFDNADLDLIVDYISTGKDYSGFYRWGNWAGLGTNKTLSGLNLEEAISIDLGILNCPTAGVV